MDLDAAYLSELERRAGCYEPEFSANEILELLDRLRRMASCRWISRAAAKKLNDQIKFWEGML